MADIRHIEEKDQLLLANIIRSVFEEYGAPLVNTVYDDPRTEHVFDALAGKNAMVFGIFLFLSVLATQDILQLLYLWSRIY